MPQDPTRELQAALEGRGDVLIGGQRRRARNRRNLSYAIGVGLVALSGVIFAAMTARTNELPSTDRVVKVQFYCTACAHEFSLSDELPLTTPPRCPKCSLPTGAPAWTCKDCAKSFAQPEAGMPARCPHCSSVSIGAAVSETAP